MTGFCSAARLRWAARRVRASAWSWSHSCFSFSRVAWMRSGVRGSWVIAARDARWLVPRF